jgi:hypothetical protein
MNSSTVARPHSGSTPIHALLVRALAGRKALLHNLSQVVTTLTTLFAAVEEGFNKAEQYEALARKSDSELAALGLSREGLPRFVMFSTTCASTSRSAQLPERKG